MNDRRQILLFLFYIIFVKSSTLPDRRRDENFLLRNSYFVGKSSLLFIVGELVYKFRYVTTVFFLDLII